MSTVSQNKKTPQEYAANYPVIHVDGYYGPLSVGNVTPFNTRILVNVCCKTTRSGDKNAVISYPESWFKDRPFPFRPGDQINILVEDGYIKKAFAAKAKSVSSISFGTINKEVADAIDKIQEEKSVEKPKEEHAQAAPMQPATVQPF